MRRGSLRQRNRFGHWRHRLCAQALVSAGRKSRRVGVPISFQPASAQLTPEPLGVVLIISPWNYPFQLALGPLVSAIAAGNCAIIKPSEVSSHTSALLARLIGDTFPENYISVIEGGVETSQVLASRAL